MKKVTIVGVGALGSHLAVFLRNTAELKLIDMDRVEQKNVLSQFHPKTNVRKNKALALQQTMNFLFGLKVAAVPHPLAMDNVGQLLDGSDLVVDCVDNAATRQTIQEYALDTGLPCLHGALAADGAFGRVVWTENFRIDSEDSVGAATCEDGVHLPFIGMASTLLARASQEFLTNGKKIGFELHPNGVIRT